MPRYRAILSDESIIDFLDSDSIEDLMVSFAEHEYLIVTPIVAPRARPAGASPDPAKEVLFWNSVLFISVL